MFKKEWQSIFKNKFMWLVLIGISLIPALYNVIFLSSMWDPYGNVDNLPVAVVNNDQSVDYNGKTLSIGKSLVSNMKKTETLDYHFVSSEKAKKGIDDGDYYLVITIPKDFSKNASTLLTDEPKSMVIDYQTTQGRSFTASKIAQNAVTELKTKVSTQVTSLYSTALLEQFGTVGDGMQSAADGTKELNSGTTQLKDGSQVIATNLDKLSSSSLTFAEGSKTLEVGLDTYLAGVTKVNSGASQVASGAAQLAEKTPTLTSAASQLASGSSVLNSGLSEYTAGVSQLATNLQNLSNTVSSGDVQRLQSGLTELQTGIENLNASVSTGDTSNGIASIQATLGTMTNLANQMQEQVDTITSDDHSALAIQAVNALKGTSGYINASDVDKEAMESAIKSAITGQTNNDTVKQNLTAEINGLKAYITGATDGLSNLKSGLQQGTSQLSTGAQVALPGANQFITNVQTGSAALTAGANQLKSKSSQLTDGSISLSSGLSQLNQQVPILASGINQLNSGASQVAVGTQQLVNNGPNLKSGTSQLTSGASQIASGASQLSSGENEVVTNLGKVQSGLSVLNTKLTDGADKINEVNTSSDSAKAIATPVKSDHTDNDKLANNGTGMAPYMMSVALFVGMITSCMIFDVYKPKKQPTSGVAWWTSKISVLALVSLVQSILVYGVVVGILGLEPVSHIGVLVLLVLQSLAYMSLIAFFTVALGKVGAFMMLIFMILQLGGSGGTYPTILSNGFFKAIHNFLPMTYGVDGLREVISIGGSIAGPIMVFIFMIIVFNLLLISYYHVKAKNFSFEDQRLEDSIQ
ncbi:MAG: YhgE/Pip domain-containing protein [Streptococcaceae bacterium]|jgi:putative membrane protein|nr:YhgE/Pip domain-containing protein [Streptococcaceae bacterium]MCH4178186.1 YhgE/Pip domain-containing protein [Streptococcaceae bacterium]